MKRTYKIRSGKPKIKRNLRAKHVPKPERYAWATVDQVPTSEPVRLRGGSKLLPLGEDAILHWVFDGHEDGTGSVLVLHLTDDEAQAVWETPQTEGMIEAIRRVLHDPWALLVREVGDSVSTRMYKVPRDTSEYEFIADLLDAADGTPRWYEEVRYMMETDLASLRGQLREERSPAVATALEAQIEDVTRSRTILDRSSHLLASV